MIRKARGPLQPVLEISLENSVRNNSAIANLSPSSMFVGNDMAVTYYWEMP
jgi:hypothetical protein